MNGSQELGCARCAQMHEKLVETIEDHNALTATVARESRRANALAAQLSAQHKADPRNAEVREVLEHWRLPEVCDHPRSAIPMDGKRAQLVRNQLKPKGDFTVTQLKLSAEGYGHFSYVADQGRAASGTEKQRHDDAKLIYRDETMVEQGLKLLKRWQASSERGGTSGGEESAPVAPPASGSPRSLGAWEPTGPVYTATPLDRAVASLRREFGFDRTFGADWDDRQMRYLDYWAPCPIQPAVASPMRVRERSPRGGSLVLACVHGHVHEELYAALRVVEQRQERLRDEAVSRAVAA